MNHAFGGKKDQTKRRGKLLNFPNFACKNKHRAYAVKLNTVFQDIKAVIWGNWVPSKTRHFGRIGWWSKKKKKVKKKIIINRNILSVDM